MEQWRVVKEGRGGTKKKTVPNFVPYFCSRLSEEKYIVCVTLNIVLTNIQYGERKIPC